MVYHVAIAPWIKINPVICYNTITKTTTFLDVENVIENNNEIQKIDELFESITSQTDGELGCVCVRLRVNCGNKIRKKFIKSGLKYGFQKVELIDWYTAIYLLAINESSYIPKNGDIIWIIEECCYIWQKFEQKIKCLNFIMADDYDSKESLYEIVEISPQKKSPNLILYNFEKCIIDENFVKNVFPECHIFCYYAGCEFVRGVLSKALMMAKDESIKNYFDISIVPALEVSIGVKLGKKEIIFYENGTLLPLKTSLLIKTNEDENVLYVIRDSINIEQSMYLPKYRKLLLTFTIDKNTIFDISFQLISPSDEILLIPKLPKQLPYFLPKEIENNHLFREVYELGGKAVGIDLGASRCCAAVNRINGIETVALDNKGGRLLPSYVAFDEKGDEHCGSIGIERLRNYPTSIVFDSKRILGHFFEDINIDKSWTFDVLKRRKQKLKSYSNLQFQIFERRNTIVQLELPQQKLTEKKATVKYPFNLTRLPRKQKPFGKIQKYPEEISAALLKHIKQKVEEFQGKELFEAVITVPAAFTEAQKDATHIAALIAGWKVIHLLPEPVAAAFAYFVDRPSMKKSTILVFDLGGGTLDVCIFKVENDQLEIISQNGDPNLGGRDFDNVLVDFFIEKLEMLHRLKVTKDKCHKLMLQCQKIKEHLSENEEDSLDAEEIDPSVEEFIPITRTEFELISSNLLNQISICISKSLKNINYGSQAIDNVLLVGGGCRMPMIKKLLQNTFPEAKHCCDKLPEEIVGIGATYYACFLTLLANVGFNYSFVKRSKIPYKVFNKRNSI